jgi:hypothetical protein
MAQVPTPGVGRLHEAHQLLVLQVHKVDVKMSSRHNGR